MPLRDHFRTPLKTQHPWHEIHGMWPAMMIQQLFAVLPAGYQAAPSSHFGRAFEIDVSTYEHTEALGYDYHEDTQGGLATIMAVKPSLTLETEIAEQDEFEVRVYDSENSRQLVAAIEIVSPANKDRPENRAAFVAKVAALLQKDVSVVIVDLVTVPEFNLYAELLQFMDRNDPKLPVPPQSHYAVAFHMKKIPPQPSQLKVWYYPLKVGEALPTLPLWLHQDLAVPLVLETSYEETCRLLRVS